MTDTQNDTSELRQHLYNLFGQNFLDGDKPSEWKATTMNASEVKEFIDEFVVPLIAQREQAPQTPEKYDITFVRRFSYVMWGFGFIAGFCVGAVFV